MRILLISTYHSHDVSPLNSGRFSLSLFGLKAWLGSYVSPAPEVHWRVYFRDFLDHLSWLGDFLEIRPHLVGFSCYMWNIEPILRTVRLLKREIEPKTKVVLGGPQVSSKRYATRLLNKHPEVDFIVRGEGEEPLGALVSALQKGGDLRSVPGITLRLGDEIHYTKEPLPLKKLDVIPQFFIEGNKVELSRAVMTHSQVSYQTYRGCRQKCGFCAYHMGGLRTFSLTRVEHDLAFILQRLRPKYLRIIDAYLGGSRKRALAILDLLAQHNVKTEVQAFHDIRHIDRDYLKACDRANALALWSAQEYGFQSSSEAVLNLANRKPEMDIFKRAMKELQAFTSEYGYPFDAVAQYIIGLPGDTYKTFRNTLVAAIRSGAAHVRSFPFFVVPGTLFYENAEALGLVHAEGGSFRVVRTPTFPEAELQRAIELARMVEAIDKIMPRTYKVLRTIEEDLGDLLDMAFEQYRTATKEHDASFICDRKLISALEGSVRGRSFVDSQVHEALKNAIRIDSESQRPD